MPQITSAAHITDSDHMIIQTQWYTKEKIVPIIRKNSHKRRIYYYEKMTQEDCDRFALKIDRKLTDPKNVEDTTDDKQDITRLNRLWNKLANMIIETAKQEVPNKLKRQNSLIRQKYSYQATKLHKLLTTIRTVLKHIEIH